MNENTKLTELKPCPHCGSVHVGPSVVGRYIVKCHCGMAAPWHPEEEKARQSWNMVVEWKEKAEKFDETNKEGIS